MTNPATRFNSLAVQAIMPHVLRSNMGSVASFVAWCLFIRFALAPLPKADLNGVMLIGLFVFGLTFRIEQIRERRIKAEHAWNEKMYPILERAIDRL